MRPRIIHRRRNLAEYALLVFLLFTLILMPGCDFVREQVASIKMPRGTDLDFETIMFEDQYYTFPKIDPGRVEVIVNGQIPPDVWITPEISSKIRAVDFSRYNVKADFIIPGLGAVVTTAMTSPKHIVKVSKEKMMNFGEITFRLWDKFGREWASASQVVPP